MCVCARACVRSGSEFLRSNRIWRVGMVKIASPWGRIKISLRPAFLPMLCWCWLVLVIVRDLINAYKVLNVP